MRYDLSLYGLFLGLLAIVVFVSCEDLIDVGQPKTELNSAVVFEDDNTATAAVLNLYRDLSVNAVVNFTIPSGLSADELVQQDGKENSQFYENDLLAINTVIETIWRNAYSAIYKTNAIIEGLEKSQGVSTPVKNQLLGEAKFFRAFYHFYLVNFFGDVPYVTVTDYRINAAVKRMPMIDVYAKIIADLVDARNLLVDDYSFSKGQRIRVNRWAATALLSRVYLYTKDYPRAEELAGQIISNTTLFSLKNDLDQVFIENSTEAIFQLSRPFPLGYTYDGAYLNRPWFNATDNVQVTQHLYTSFENNDKRKTNWLGIGQSGVNTFCYATKYQENYTDTIGPNEATMVLRLAEVLLIRAEARVRQEKITGTGSAEVDVNTIRSRAGLLPTTAITQQQMLQAIEHERRWELFTEFGHRWFDLKRTGRVNDVMQTVNPIWASTDAWYPLPFSELNLNPNLKPQNDGY